MHMPLCLKGYRRARSHNSAIWSVAWMAVLLHHVTYTGEVRIFVNYWTNLFIRSYCFHDITKWYIILVWPTSWTASCTTLIVCVCVCVRACARVCVCVSGDVSPYCSAHDEWLIMKLCMYVRYHTANNVSNFGGDPVTQLYFKSYNA